MSAPVPEAARIAAAQAYIDALVSHDASAVPFTDDCVRIELGVKTGFSGAHLRRSLDRGPQFKLIKAATTPDYSVTDDEVRAVYDIITKPALAGRRVCARVDETFIIPATSADGAAHIHHIRATFRPFLGR
ncbi:hypothetical protein H7J07_19765 [Mycobacterium koreense]|uniref:DUF8021 domain-containing protein n=1 Tax=Mycolicibacillus koreensis TaxID=1069220 RepID=A0A7I7SK03_9MYCO|nr:hypothetical protein [Mycolicibacillus koreensis]MCV7250432.1 hypothetical protein [Mycolicibacillus koreensis]ODR06159.1 hypothetical protein BHQ15_14105 [Mycolicibacillus koreensis]OSC33314.1 hypothetical protein B8W67_11235 [Mycolicibacillus koreensis]BBY56315.1 hypothetical protein MKOR_35660 [Mycolicibacillus koreensis]